MDNRKHPLSQREFFTQKQVEAMYHALCAIREMAVNTQAPPTQKLLETMWDESKDIFQVADMLLRDIDSDLPVDSWIPSSHAPEPITCTSSDDDDDLPF